MISWTSLRLGYLGSKMMSSAQVKGPRLVEGHRLVSTPEVTFFIQSLSYGLLFPFNEVGVSLLVSVGWSVCRTRGIMIPLLYFEIIRSKVSLNGPPPWKQFTINILRKADFRTLNLYGMVGLDEKMTPIIFVSLCQRSSSQGLHLFFGLWSVTYEHTSSGIDTR